MTEHSLQTKLWRINNREAYLSNRRRYRTTEAYRKKAKTYGNKKKSIGGITLGILCEMFKRNFTENKFLKCVLCSYEIKENPSIEHLIPISKGGTNKIDNLDFSHLICNSFRKNMDLVEFKKLSGRTTSQVCGLLESRSS